MNTILTHDAEPHPAGGYTLTARYSNRLGVPYHCPNIRPDDLSLICARTWLGLIQEAFPHLTPDEREYVLTGLTPEEWDAMLL